ncbi:MAG: hypothetical protein K5905_14920 [Roseibium sp.]|uniref:hypothetical protein n=1 Tax=Roseibium sp. TaxID=1936156 RepID=UPI00262DDC07|nr:hypothetical protein [Roseibium sp.]MCV0426753.1 hypothetical protein [Roseibium sp.]
MKKSVVLVFGVISLLLLQLISAVAEDYRASEQRIRPIYPSGSIESEEVENFSRMMIQVYTFYGRLLDPADNRPNFIFLSGDGFIDEGKIRLSKIKKFFPGMTQEEADFFSGESNSCLVFKLPLSDAEITVGINDTQSGTQPMNLHCFLDALAFFLDEEGYEGLRGETVREHARNIIDTLVDRFK